MTEWQDISTAPKDGTKILLFTDDVNLGSYRTWCGSDKCWRDVGGATISRPTRWQPLPEGPKA